MMTVPLQPIPSQQINVLLNNQPTTLNVYAKAFGLFMDVYLNQTLVIAGVICLNLNVIIRDAYLGYLGDFAFYDTTGNGNDPTYTGLGTTYQLYYFAPADLPAILS
jgi:hypothetical protein